MIAKFVPGLSTVAPPMAGLSKMPWWKFLGADGLGGFLWAGGFLLVGHIFRAQLEDVGLYAARLGGSLITVLVGAATLWILWKYYQRRKFIKGLRVARIRPEELKLMLQDVVILDLRTAEEYQSDGR